MEISLIQTIKLSIISMTGLSRDALHVYAGLAIFLTCCVAFKQSKRLSWLIVLAFAIIVEILDLRDDIHSFGFFRWGESTHDIINTIFWPTVMLWVMRHCDDVSYAKKKR